MSLRPCRECRTFVSEEAPTCPRCGVRRPVVTDEDAGWFGKYRGAIALALVVGTLEIAWFRYQIGQLSGPPPSPDPVAPVDSYPGYHSLATGTWLDARLYEREDRTYVGRITSLNCPDPTPRGSPLRCFEVEFADGHREWVRRHVAAKRYLAVIAH
jgi:hypothetical protein